MKPLIPASVILCMVFAPAAAEAKGCIKGAVVGGLQAIWWGTARSAWLPDASSAVMKPTSGTPRRPIKGRLPRPETIAFRSFRRGAACHSGTVGDADAVARDYFSRTLACAMAKRR